MKNFLKFVLLFSVAGLTLIYSSKQPSKPQHLGTKEVKIPLAQPVTSPSVVMPSNIGKFLVTRVLDGDTIEIEGKEKIRYIGIDTPETVDPRKPVGCFGREASDKNKELILGKKVSLEKDVSETDKYGRLLRYVYVDDVFVNDYLLRQGFAHASSYPPDIKYQEQFRQAQQEAQKDERGLWSQCNGESKIQSLVSDNCTIKGNISASGEKIYHLPGQKFYEKTVINSERGEQWFCTEDEAQRAGFRKSKL